MRFTLRQLEYFVTTCATGSITRAAASIPVAQSSVSAAIGQLEAALDVQLLIRHHAQGVSPTPAGRRFLVKARALLRDANELERFASELTHDLSGKLELGCLVTLAPLVTPRLSQDFLTRHSGVELELLEASHLELLERLREGDITLALTYDLELHDDIAFQPLVKLPPYALFPRDHALANRDSVTLRELADEPLVLLDIPHSRDYFHGLFAAKGLRARVTQRSTQPDVLRTLVANGFGYGIVNARPRIDRALDGSVLRTVRIAGSPRPMVLGIASMTDVRDSRVGAAFREHCVREITSRSAPGLRMDGA
jgi:DNA-binding transcriptional LysR family regulator